MLEQEILALKKRRGQLSTIIRNYIERKRYAYDKVLEFIELTKKLNSCGCKLSCDNEYVKLENWEKGGKFYHCLGYPKTNSAETSRVGTTKAGTTKAGTTKAGTTKAGTTPNDDQPKTYILCLAWTNNKGDGESKQVKEIKSLINTLYMKLVDTEEVTNGDRVDHILKYEFVGTHDAFSLLKQVLQWVADSFAVNEMDKFNVAVYGKKKR